MESFSGKTIEHESSGFKVFQAHSAIYRRKVLVKEYYCSDIYAAEGLLKEAITQVREKRRESAVLIGVSLSRIEDDNACYVNFVLDIKQQDVERGLIERNDGLKQWQPGFAEYTICDTIYALDKKKVEVARSSRTGEEVVIKSVTCDWANQANELAAEAFVLAIVEHPHICKLIDICISRAAGGKFRINLILEKLECSLDQDISERRCNIKPYREAQLLKFLQEVTSALAHAKSLVSSRQGIAHRDIKPGNIFIDVNGTYKVGDFGSAWTKNEATLTKSGAGTPFYMSPEMQQCLINPETNQVDSFRADIYSLGVTALHMAIQRPPIKINPLVKEDIDRIPRRKLSRMVVLDPLLNSLRDSDITNEKFRAKLAMDTNLAIRFNIILSSKQTLKAIAYSEELKQLLSKMIAIDHTQRIRLEDVISAINTLVSRPGVSIMRATSHMDYMQNLYSEIMEREQQLVAKLDKAGFRIAYKSTDFTTTLGLNGEITVDFGALNIKTYSSRIEQMKFEHENKFEAIESNLMKRITEIQNEFRKRMQITDEEGKNESFRNASHGGKFSKMRERLAELEGEIPKLWKSINYLGVQLRKRQEDNEKAISQHYEQKFRKFSEKMQSSLKAGLADLHSRKIRADENLH